MLLTYQSCECSSGVERGVTEAGQVAAWHFDASFDLAQLALAVVNQACQRGNSKVGRETSSSKFFSKPDGLLDHMNLRHCLSEQPEITVCTTLSQLNRIGKARSVVSCFLFIRQ
jgi:hypothetical protein